MTFSLTTLILPTDRLYSTTSTFLLPYIFSQYSRNSPFVEQYLDHK